MIRLAKHSISTPFQANWDQSNPHDTNYLATYDDKAVNLVVYDVLTCFHWYYQFPSNTSISFEYALKFKVMVRFLQ